MRLVWIFLVLAWSATAGEYVVLTSGAQMHALRHDRDGSMVRLYTATGTIEFPAGEVVRIEKEDYVPPPKPAAHAEPPAPTPRQLVDAAAQKHGLPPQFVRSVVAAESGYRADAVSRKGAIGLMQLMPATAKKLGVDPANPAQNVDGGAAYLRQLLLKYGYNSALALAAYNAGPGAVEKYHGVPPYPETQAYINRVIRNYQKK